MDLRIGSPSGEATAATLAALLNVPRLFGAAAARMSANGMDRPCSCPQIAGATKPEEHAPWTAKPPTAL
jgi:hypothetical protein